MKPEKMLKLLEVELQPGETITAVLKAALAKNEDKKHQTGFMPPGESWGGLAVTDSRIIFSGKFGFQKISRSIPLAHITSVELDKRLLHTLIKFTVAGGHQLFILYSSKEEAAAFVSVIKNSLMTTIAPKSSVSVADELTKLAELRKQGILTDADLQPRRQGFLVSRCIDYDYIVIAPFFSDFFL